VRNRNRYRKERNRTQKREELLDKEFTELLDDVADHETETAAANVSIDFLRNQVEKLQERNAQLAQDNVRSLRQQQQRNKLLKRELQRARNRATTWENRWNALKAQIPEHPERESQRLRGYAAELEVDDEAILM
jgi:chromosome segregation ATPase